MWLQINREGSDVSVVINLYSVYNITIEASDNTVIFFYNFTEGCYDKFKLTDEQILKLKSIIKVVEL